MAESDVIKSIRVVPEESAMAYAGVGFRFSIYRSICVCVTYGIHITTDQIRYQIEMCVCAIQFNSTAGWRREDNNGMG